MYNCTVNQSAVTVELTEFSINVKIHLVLRVGIQSSNLQEVECGFYLLSRIQTKKVNKVKISAGIVKEKASYCTVTGGVSGKKYLSGNLWRQEIETPCCEDLKKKAN